MRRFAGFLGAALGAGLLTGCVEQRYVVTSDPPGALVYVNGKPLGATPADGTYIYHGDYDITIVKPGYQTLHDRKCISTPWYEYFPLDFISENLIPWRIRDVRCFNYVLEPLKAPDIEALRARSDQLRAQGLAIVVPPQPPESGRPPIEAGPKPNPVAPAGSIISSP